MARAFPPHLEFSLDARSLSAHELGEFDHMDSGHCHFCGKDRQPTHIRLNVAGVWSVMCLNCRGVLISLLRDPDQLTTHRGPRQTW